MLYIRCFSLTEGPGTQGHIYLVLRQEDKAFSCFTRALYDLANDPTDLTGVPILQDDLENSLLFKYYGLSRDLFNEEKGRDLRACQIESWFKLLVLPYAQKNDAGNIEFYWDLALIAITNKEIDGKSADDASCDNDYWRLRQEEEKNLREMGKGDEADFILKRSKDGLPGP